MADTTKQMKATGQDAFDKLKDKLEPFIQAARVCEFYVEDVIPEMTFPKPGTRTHTLDHAPWPVTLEPSDFLALKAAYEAALNAASHTRAALEEARADLEIWEGAFRLLSIQLGPKWTATSNECARASAQVRDRIRRIDAALNPDGGKS